LNPAGIVRIGHQLGSFVNTADFKLQFRKKKHKWGKRQEKEETNTCNMCSRSASYPPQSHFNPELSFEKVLMAALRKQQIENTDN